MATVEIKREINLDPLDSAIVDTVNAEGEITLQDLAQRLPEYRYQTVWYRCRTLNEWGLIRKGKITRGKAVTCRSIGSG
jgi:predicted MarR family transcription regulator